MCFFLIAIATTPIQPNMSTNKAQSQIAQCERVLTIQGSLTLRLRFVIASSRLCRSCWCCCNRTVWTLPLNPVQPISCDKKNRGRNQCERLRDLQDLYSSFFPIEKKCTTSSNLESIPTAKKLTSSLTMFWFLFPHYTYWTIAWKPGILKWFFVVIHHWLIRGKWSSPKKSIEFFTIRSHLHFKPKFTSKGLTNFKKLPHVGFELTTLTITGSKAECLSK